MEDEVAGNRFRSRHAHRWPLSYRALSCELAIKDMYMNFLVVERLEGGQRMSIVLCSHATFRVHRLPRWTTDGGRSMSYSEKI